MAVSVFLVVPSLRAKTNFLVPRLQLGNAYGNLDRKKVGQIVKLAVRYAFPRRAWERGITNTL
jgi:hypothetical protein